MLNRCLKFYLLMLKLNYLLCLPIHLKSPNCFHLKLREESRQFKRKRRQFKVVAVEREDKAKDVSTTTLLVQ